MTTNIEIREGFLCPICMKDLGDVNQLQVHFAEIHQSSQDKDAAVQIRGFLERAKRLWSPELPAALQNVAHHPDSILKRSVSSGAAVFRVSEPQECGASRTYTEYFKRERDSTIDRLVVDTNKLLIRLDKLVSEAPSDPALRKEYERKVIPWKDDGEVQMCKFCKCRFSLTKRKHHCRLCGKLTNPAYAATYDAEAENLQRQQAAATHVSPTRMAAAKAERFLKVGLNKLKLDGSEVSVNSLSNQEGEDHLRICRTCKELLDRRDQQVEQRTQPPIVVQMYERLTGLMAEVETACPTFLQMADSLNAGESLYNLETAKNLRLKLMKLSEQIDFTSKKIAQLGLSDNAASPRVQLLQRNVRQRAMGFLQDLTFGLPNLPTPDEYATLQAACKVATQKRIDQERLDAQNASVKVSQLSPNYSLHKYGRTIAAPEDSGWTADMSFVSPFQDDDAVIDPLKQQIGILKGFIRQAAEAGRLGEVQTLEQNLRELQNEIKQQELSAVSPRLDMASR